MHALPKRELVKVRCQSLPNLVVLLYRMSFEIQVSDTFPSFRAIRVGLFQQTITQLGRIFGSHFGRCFSFEKGPGAIVYRRRTSTIKRNQLRARLDVVGKFAPSVDIGKREMRQWIIWLSGNHLLEQ